MTMCHWQPIETVPKKGQVLVTCWEPGDPWACNIELVNLPFLADGRVMNQNSGNYTQPGIWKWWMPLPEPPSPAHGENAPAKEGT